MTGALRDVKNLLRISLLDLSGCGVGEFFFTQVFDTVRNILI